ncbi:MAG TPA: GSU2403 family nucleotidyltransferase fold protein [Frankiaceae bacterium]|nr:GSU2403 family nucleotidyltransferase fold protein [Frankiaceae bacterium]
MNATPTPEYVVARSVLLDALAALGVHRDAVVLVGAQAVYLHTGDADLAVAPTTTDADLALAPALLPDAPLLGDVMRSAGFKPGADPGTWTGRFGVAIDLLVPEALSGRGGRRGARLPAHGNDVARRALGLEAAVVANAPHEVGALATGDSRRFTIRVAQPAALLVAKVIKIEERRATPGRLRPKDGLDVLRLLQTSATDHLAADLDRLVADDLAGPVTRMAMDALREHGSDPDGPVTTLAVTAAGVLANPDTIRASVPALVADLLAAVR